MVRLKIAVAPEAAKTEGANDKEEDQDGYEDAEYELAIWSGFIFEVFNAFDRLGVFRSFAFWGSFSSSFLFHKFMALVVMVIL